MFKWLFHISIFATNDGSGKYQNKEKPLKCQRKLGLVGSKTAVYPYSGIGHRNITCFIAILNKFISKLYLFYCD